MCRGFVVIGVVGGGDVSRNVIDNYRTEILKIEETTQGDLWQELIIPSEGKAEMIKEVGKLKHMSRKITCQRLRKRSHHMDPVELSNTDKRSLLEDATSLTALREEPFHHWQ